MPNQGPDEEIFKTGHPFILVLQILSVLFCICCASTSFAVMFLFLNGTEMPEWLFYIGTAVWVSFWAWYGLDRFRRVPQPLVAALVSCISWVGPSVLLYILSFLPFRTQRHNAATAGAASLLIGLILWSVDLLYVFQGHDPSQTYKPSWIDWLG